MGFRLYRSIRLGGGIRLNLSKTGLGLSFGVPGARYSIHSSGRTVRTVGLPGTGLYWRTDRHFGTTPRRRATTSRRAASAPALRAQPRPPVTPAPQPQHAPHPGLFAHRGEKDLWHALATDDVAAMDAVATAHPELRVAAETLSGLHRLAADPTGARLLLGQVFASGADPGTDPFLTRYVVPTTHVQVTLAPGVTTALPLNRETVGLVLAELHQTADDLAAAIDVVEQLGPDAHTALSLADLYVASARWTDVVELTDGVTNVDDSSALLLVLRGIALRELGHHDAARHALTDALRARSRAVGIRHRALLERARTHLADGHKAPARRDLERVLADDADYPGVADALART